MSDKHRNQEGAALFVVMLIVMVGTAAAVFAANTVAYEVRGSGFARQRLQTRHAARAALVGALEWYDIFGPETVRNIMLSKGSTEGKAFTCIADGTCYPEPPLPNGRLAYRLYEQHFDALVTEGDLVSSPIEADALFGPRSVYTPAIVIDLYDDHVISRMPAGAAAQGGTKFKYMRTTLTARGRAQVAGGDHAELEDMNRQWNETGADMRAYVISGPFVSGS